MMRCAYPVCPNIQARIFPQHPPTMHIYPALGDDTAEFVIGTSLKVIICSNVSEILPHKGTLQ